MDELALITRIAQTYEHRELAYALDRLTLVATQLRARSALLIGALDKVGLFPLFVGAYFSLRALLREQPPTSSELTWIIGGAIGLGGVYLMTSGLLRWAQRLDDACVVLKHAGQAKPSAPPMGSNGQGAQDQGHVAIAAPRACWRALVSGRSYPVRGGSSDTPGQGAHWRLR
jgi:hypothetical protein